MDPRARVVADDGRHETPISHASALGHFRRVIEDAWKTPSPDTALAKRRLDFYCGHIDRMPGLKDFVPVDVVAKHFSALNPDVRENLPGFGSSLTLYLSLIAAEIHADKSAFRGASVALTFDRARFDMNMARFDQDEPVLALLLRRDRDAEPHR